MRTHLAAFTAATAPQSTSPTKPARDCRLSDQYTVREEGTATEEAIVEEDMETRSANTAEEQCSTRACGVAQLAEGRQKKISGHERRALLGSA